MANSIFKIFRILWTKWQMGKMKFLNMNMQLMELLIKFKMQWDPCLKVEVNFKLMLI